MKQKSRLKKIALMPEQMFESTLDQVSDKGRAILKAIEDYKFNLDQTMRVVKNDQNLTSIIQQKKKNLDHAAQDLYNIVFEIENIDISAAYNEQQAPQESTPDNKDSEQTPQGQEQSQQGQPQNAPSDQAAPPAGGSGGGNTSPAPAQKPEGKQKEDGADEETPENGQSKDDSKPTPEKPEKSEEEEKEKK